MTNLPSALAFVGALACAAFMAAYDHEVIAAWIVIFVFVFQTWGFEKK